MSLAIPSSYDEYLFDQTTRHSDPQMLCNGGIFTTRPTGSQYQNSTNWWKCLRGEDVFFLREAIFSRTSMNDYSYQQNLGQGMDNEIRAEKLQLPRDCVWNTRNMWQQEPLSIYSHDFGEVSSLENWDYGQVNTFIFSQIQGIGTGSQNINFSRGNSFDTGPLYRLFQEVRKMNYSFDRTHCLEMAFSTEHTAHQHYFWEGQWYDDDIQRFDMWYDLEEESFRNTSSLWSANTFKSLSDTLNIDLWTQQNNAWVRVADYLPMGLFHVENVWSWYNNTTQQEGGGTPVGHMVLIPLASSYLTVVGGGAHLQGLRSPSDIVADAYATSGLCQNARDIQMDTPPVVRGEWGWQNTSFLKLDSIYHLVHFKYCVP